MQSANRRTVETTRRYRQPKRPDQCANTDRARSPPGWTERERVLRPGVATQLFHFHYTPRPGACGKARVVRHNRRMNADVIVVGAGPTGLVLAGELALASADEDTVSRAAGRA